MFEIQIVCKTETDQLLSRFYPIRNFEDAFNAFNDFNINILSEANDNLYEYPFAIELEITKSISIFSLSVSQYWSRKI